ncbi:hypothetical protein D3C78_1061150 [compost metagenome]
MVVDHVGQEVGRQAVVLHQHLHVHAVPWDLDIATEHVRNHADTFARYLHADHMGLASGQAALHLLVAQQQRAAIVARGFATGHLLGAHLLQLFGGAEAVERMAGIDQLLGVLGVDLAALALPVRAVRAAHIRAFVPFDAKPAQGVEDLLLRLAGRAQLVGVLDAQDELTAMLLGEAVVEQGDVGGADMGVARGRWRDTRAYGGHGGSRTKDETKARC